jgi:acetyltransferase-like isoleucine patch superfamily enzyme
MKIIFNIYKKATSIYRSIKYRNNQIEYFRTLGVIFGKNCRLVGKNDFGREPFLVTIGNHVSITTSTFITHDGGVWVFREQKPTINIIKPINVGNNVFIGADCLILPGVTIEDNIVLGARSVVTKNLAKNAVYAGTPARFIKSIDDYWTGIEPYILNTKGLSKSDKDAFLKKLYRNTEDQQ